MMVRLTLDGASKCDLRDFLLEEWVAIWEVSYKGSGVCLMPLRKAGSMSAGVYTYRS